MPNSTLHAQILPKTIHAKLGKPDKYGRMGMGTCSIIRLLQETFGWIDPAAFAFLERVGKVVTGTCMAVNGERHARHLHYAMPPAVGLRPSSSPVRGEGRPRPALNPHVQCRHFTSSWLLRWPQWQLHCGSILHPWRRRFLHSKVWGFTCVSACVLLVWLTQV